MARLLYFAALADRLGRTSEDAALPPQVDTVRALLAWLRGRGDPWTRWLADDSVRVTVNRQLVALEAPVGDRDEIAILSTTLR